ncbi:MAG: hypothetical protein RBR59_09435 [Sulfurimonadaceae bacterium]|jgi:hypothetical protein|nr:hypothetical protein [Sulfurimonadaceae bacterium]
MLQKEKERLLKKLFNDKRLFEKEVLGVFSFAEKKEIVELLAKRIVHKKYKKSFSFLAINDLASFELSRLETILFQEIIHEFIAYGVEYLYIEKEEAYAYLRKKENRIFIHMLTKEYLLEYSKYFYSEIADTFLELIVTIPHANMPSPLILEVLESPLVRQENVLVIHNFEQLYNRVRAALNYKNTLLAKLQVQIAEETQKQEDINPIKLEYLTIKLEKITKTTLDNYDAALKRLKDTMIHAMQSSNTI